MSLSPLAPSTTLKLGGAPRVFREAGSDQAVLAALDEAERLQLPVLILGGGSNIVVADEGVDALVLQPTMGGVVTETDGDAVLVEVGAGHDWDAFTQYTTARGYQGIECLGGIPGKVGATPIQNVGAYGQEVSDTVESAVVLDRRTGQSRRLDSKALSFSYRSSTFKREARGRYVVVAVRFRLHPAAPPRIRYGELSRAVDELDDPKDLSRVRDLVVALRRKKSMVFDRADENHRSCGSFFVNVQVPEGEVARIARRAESEPPTFPGDSGLVKLPSAWLIEQAGLTRGTHLGPVGLSTKHALCIVAHDGATAKNVVEFAWFVRRRVRDAFGVTLMPEPQFWGFDELDEGLPILNPETNA